MRREIFPWLVEHHYDTLDELLVKEGLLPIQKYDLREGSDRNVPYHGFLFMVDGPKILDRLNEEGLINDMSEEIRREYDHSEPLLTKDDFLSYLRKQELEGEDGAYVFNSVTGKVVSCHFNNNPNLLGDFSLTDRLPSNFVFYDAEQLDLKYIGTKTRVAIKIPASMDNVHAYQVKRSPYGNKSTGIGMGKVTHFESFGLSEEFFFKRNDGVISGVYRPYFAKEDYRSPKDLIISDLSRFEEIRAEAREQYEKAA